MERMDQELLNSLIDSQPNLKRLHEKHQKLEREIANFSLYATYSASASLKVHELKKEKLRIRENLMTMLREYREQPQQRAA